MTTWVGEPPRTVLFAGLFVIVVVTVTVAALVRKMPESGPIYTQRECERFVRDTVGAAPGAEARAIKLKIHSCVDQGLLDPHYKLTNRL